MLDHLMRDGSIVLENVIVICACSNCDLFGNWKQLCKLVVGDIMKLHSMELRDNQLDNPFVNCLHTKIDLIGDLRHALGSKAGCPKKPELFRFHRADMMSVPSSSVEVYHLSTLRTLKDGISPLIILQKIQAMTNASCERLSITSCCCPISFWVQTEDEKYLQDE